MRAKPKINFDRVFHKGKNSVEINLRTPFTLRTPFKGNFVNGRMKVLEGKIGRPGNEDEVEVEKLEVGHVEESPARGKHELWEKKITVNKRKSKQQTKLTKLM